MIKKAKYEFGQKLKGIRESKQLTIRQLAEGIGVTESFISQIERNKVSPSVDTLLALVDFLDIDFDYIFQDYKRNRQFSVVRQEDRRKINIDGFYYEKLSVFAKESDLRPLEAFYLTVSPHCYRNSPATGHSGVEFGIILEGCLEITYDKVVCLLNAGDSVSFDSRQTHEFRNPLDVPMKAIWVVTPPKDTLGI